MNHATLSASDSTELSIVEDAVPPSLSISVSQDTNQGQFVNASGGLVTASIEISDPNGTHQADWTATDNNLVAEESTDTLMFSFNPTGLAEGTYLLEAAVTEYRLNTTQLVHRTR